MFICSRLICYCKYILHATVILIVIAIIYCAQLSIRQISDVAKLNSEEWYFFSFHDCKYATGYRTNQATISGYWKPTGKDRVVLDPTTRAIVGMRKTLVFYKHRAPNGVKTGWIMHEFRLENPLMPPKVSIIIFISINFILKTNYANKLFTFIPTRIINRTRALIIGNFSDFFIFNLIKFFFVWFYKYIWGFIIAFRIYFLLITL